MTIGERIRNARLSIDMSQVELAKKAKTTKQNIYKYETGIITNIPSDKIEAIADALEVPAAHLMGWDNKEKLSNSTSDFLIMVNESPKLKQLIRDFNALTPNQQETVLALIHSMISDKHN